MIRMRIGKERGPDVPLDHPVRLFLAGLAKLVLDDLALAVELGLIQHFGPGLHAIALEPEGCFNARRGNGLVKRRSVRVGPSVDVLGADVGESSEVLVRGHVPRALEHQVLAEMCQPSAMRRVVLGPDVTPEVDGDERDRVVFRKNNLEAVAEAIALGLHWQMLGHRVVERVGRSGRRTAGGGKRGDAQKHA
jgi:hypothetical protein